MHQQTFPVKCELNLRIILIDLQVIRTLEAKITNQHGVPAIEVLYFCYTTGGRIKSPGEFSEAAKLLMALIAILTQESTPICPVFITRS